MKTEIDVASPLDQILQRINKAKEDYDLLKLSQVSEQAEILRALTISYANLTDHRIEAKERWDRYYFHSEGTNALRERTADKEVPELYKIRRIMDAAKLLIDAVRSTISAAKHDK